MARGRTPAQLAKALDRVATKRPDDVDTGPAPEPAPKPEPERDQEHGGGHVDVDHAGPGRARRMVVRVPSTLRARLERHARRTGRTYTAVVLDAYAAHAGELLNAAGAIQATSPGPGGLPRLPQRDVGADGRRRGISAVDLPLSLYSAEREVLEAAVAAGAAHTLSDLVTRLLELALPTPGRHR